MTTIRQIAGVVSAFADPLMTEREAEDFQMWANEVWPRYAFGGEIEPSADAWQLMLRDFRKVPAKEIEAMTASVLARQGLSRSNAPASRATPRKAAPGSFGETTIADHPSARHDAGAPGGDSSSLLTPPGRRS